MVDHSHAGRAHGHVFLGAAHAASERKTWIVIGLCTAMMVAEIVGGWLFGSIALIADGLHMSTHAGAMLLAALAYTLARRHAHDPRFTFGTGKLGDLAGFASAIILAMISLLIGYESISRVFAPVSIHFAEAIPIATLGLAINVASAWLLAGDHDHAHGHAHGHGEDHAHAHDEVRSVVTGVGVVTVEVFERGAPPRFRLRALEGPQLVAAAVGVETVRQNGARQRFALADRGDHLESIDDIPEPHAFTVELSLGDERHAVMFEEHAHAQAAHRDNNMRAALVHVIADAAVSGLVIIGLLLARAFGWLWMDPLAGIVGAAVIASWSYGLIRDTGAILLDMNPDPKLSDRLRREVEAHGDAVEDLHLWRLGPGHLGAIVGVATDAGRDPDFYRRRLAHLPGVSHLTVEVRRS